MLYGVFTDVEPVAPEVSVNTGQVELQRLRAEQSDNDEIIRTEKAKKTTLVQELRDTDAKIIGARQRNADLEEQIKAITDWGEQQIIYQTTGEVQQANRGEVKAEAFQ